MTSAQKLERAGYTSEAFQMVEERKGSITDSRLLEWLANQYERKGEQQKVLDIRLRIWRGNRGTSLEAYKV